MLSKESEYDNSMSYSAPKSNVYFIHSMHLKVKPCKACSSQWHDHPMRTHFYQGQNGRNPGTGYPFCAGKLEQIIYLVYMWLTEQSNVGEVHPNALCRIRVAVCMRSVSNSSHFLQMFKPSLHPPPHTLPWWSERARRDRGLFCSSIFEYSFVFAVCNSLF